MNPHPALVALTWLWLKEMPTDQLAAAYNALTDSGRVSPENLGFDFLHKTTLIFDDGRPRDRDSLITAFGHEIPRRLAAESLQPPDPLAE